MESNDNLVEEHRKMLIISGNLSQFQITNISNWPWVLCEDLEKCKVKYSFLKKIPDQENEGVFQDLVYSGEVLYTWIFKKKTKRSEIKKQIDQITEWTKFLFWNDTVVKVKVQDGSRKD